MTTPTEPPPPFGHQLRKYFGFEADYVNMNNGQATFHTRATHFGRPDAFILTGSYGSVPIPVSAAIEATSKFIEGNVDRFIKLHIPEYLTPARHRMAKFVGAGPEEIVFVPNASHGLNTVLRNLTWNEGDIIVTGRGGPLHMPVTPLLTWPRSHDDIFSHRTGFEIYQRFATSPFCFCI